jgi:hypothetical protein
MLSTDDKAVNLEMSLKFVMVLLPTLRMNEGRDHLTEDGWVIIVTTVVAIVGVIISGREDRGIRAINVVAIRRK